MGIVAEFFKVNDYERDALTAIFLNTLRGRKPYSLISVTDWSTDVAVKRAQQYERMGANTLMLLPPFYFEPGVDGIREHMKRVLEAVDIPVLIQYAPQLPTPTYPTMNSSTWPPVIPTPRFKIEI
jgi:4-hydroxy-tetrahydrodipicolinate synthase